MMDEGIGNTVKTLTKAQYGRIGEGVQVYFGTPLQRGSAFWEIWNKSTQQYYHLGCEKCKQFFPLHTPGTNDWESIWIYGMVVRCPHCGCEQHKVEAIERGKCRGCEVPWSPTSCPKAQRRTPTHDSGGDFGGIFRRYLGISS